MAQVANIEYEQALLNTNVSKKYIKLIYIFVRNIWQKWLIQVIETKQGLGFL